MYLNTLLMISGFTQWTGNLPTWTIFLIIIPAIAIWLFYKKDHMVYKDEYDKLHGLPKGFKPATFLGPIRTPGVFTKTPAGIMVYTNGFDKKDIPETKNGAPARVNLAQIDVIWRNVRSRLANTGYPDASGKNALGKKARARIAELPDAPPWLQIQIAPTIWWDDSNGCYVAGLTSAGYNSKHTYMINCSVAVWYPSPEKGIQDWSNLLDWEFKNAILISIGRSDLAS